MGLHNGAPKLKAPRFYYPGGDDKNNEMVALYDWPERDKIEPAKSSTITDEEIREFAKSHVAEYEVFVLSEIRQRVAKAIVHLEDTATDRFSHTGGYFTNYMKSYAQIIECITFEPSTSTAAVYTDQIRAVLWDLKAIRVQFEATAPIGRIITNLRAVEEMIYEFFLDSLNDDALLEA